MKILQSVVGGSWTTRWRLARRVGHAPLLAALIVGTACASLSQATPTLDLDVPPRQLPIEQLSDVDGEGFRAVLAGLRGTPVVVNVWASWCGPCRVEAPLLQRAADRYGERVTFLGVASKDERGGAARFLNRYRIDYPNVLDRSGEIRRLLGLRGFPTTYLVDRSGRVRSAVVGGISEQVLAARLDDLLRE